MIGSNSFQRITGLFPTGNYLIRQAKSGRVNAFVELCNMHLEGVYRYLHFLSPNNRIAESLTLQTLFKAWKKLDRYRMLETSFETWLYSIARTQVIEYWRLHRNNAPADNAVSQAVRGGEFRQEFQTIRDALNSVNADEAHALVSKFIIGLPDSDAARILSKKTGDIRAMQLESLCVLAKRHGKTDSTTLSKGLDHVLDDCLDRISNGASTLEECLTRHSQHSSELKPLLQAALMLTIGREAKPQPEFTEYTHQALSQNLRVHSHQSPQIFVPEVRRWALAFTVLLVTFIVTGTVHAQTAMPGEAYYDWKRTSEYVWHAFSPDPLAVDISLTERRLGEWIVVRNNPSLSGNAKKDYEEALSLLESEYEEDDLALIASELESQQEMLEEVGLSSPELNETLKAVTVELNGAPPAQPVMEIPVTATAVTNNSSAEVCPPECDGIPNAGNGHGVNNGGNNNGVGNNAGGNNNPGANSNSGGNNNAGGNNAGGNNAGGNNAGGNNNNGGDNDDGGEGDHGGGKNK